MGRVPMRILRCAAGLILLLAQVGWAAATDATDLAGRAIYLEGRLPSGEPVNAVVQQGVALSGADAACVQCHRRSGLGGSEGQNAIRPIAGRLLFAAQPGGRDTRWAELASAAGRLPYTRASLTRALRDGVDPAGRALDPLMPRYRLGDDEIVQLHAYLQGLGPEAAPGVTDDAIHFSTVITPEVDAGKRRALLDVLQAFFRDKNGGTRHELRRREVGSEPMYRAFRRWVLHAWELRGTPDTWRDQLEAHYRRQPVFAVLGGVGRASWEPVHAFCEASALPCVLPDVDYPVLAAPGYHSVYFSRGVRQEAEVLAQHLVEALPAPGEARIVQVFRDDALGRLPAQALREALRRRGGGVVVDYPLGGGLPADAAFWARLWHDAHPAVLVLWLDDADLRDLAAGGAPPAALQAVYLSASRSAGPWAGLSSDWLGRLRMVSLFEPPARRERHLARMKAWLRSRSIAPADERVQANAYFAATLAGEVIAHLGENFSRDYFLEGIEQMAEVSLAPSIYPHLSLGPGQRVASRGGGILGFSPGEGESASPLSGWRVP